MQKLSYQTAEGVAPRVLVIDDDWLNRDLLGVYLEDAGYRFELASDGPSGLDLAFANPPDIVLCDVQMPRMNGYEVCRQLKQHPSTRFVPVVMVTALDSDEEKLRAVEVGADDFITKPFNSIMLLTRVRSLLRIKYLHDDVEARNELLRQVLDRYMAEDVVNTILTNPEQTLKLGGENKQIAVLFADIRGFTPYSRRVGAQQTVATLNRVFPRLTDVIFKYEGTFDKFVGDAIMAFWGAPVSRDDDLERSLHAALEMRDTFAQMRDEYPDELGDLGLGLGLHWGDATVGNIGSERVMDYTVIGDTVNLAARLQEVAEAGEILVTEPAFSPVAPLFDAEQIAPRPLYGHQQVPPVFRLRGTRNSR